MSHIHIHVYTSNGTLVRQSLNLNASRHVTYAHVHVTYTNVHESCHTRSSVAALKCVMPCHVYTYTCTWVMSHSLVGHRTWMRHIISRIHIHMHTSMSRSLVSRRAWTRYVMSHIHTLGSWKTHAHLRIHTHTHTHARESGILANTDKTTTKNTIEKKQWEGGREGGRNRKTHAYTHAHTHIHTQVRAQTDTDMNTVLSYIFQSQVPEMHFSWETK